MSVLKSVQARLARPGPRAGSSGVHLPRPRSGLRLSLEQLEDRVVPATLLGSLGLGSQPLGELAVNPNSDRAYVAGGFGPSPLSVVNASDPTNPALMTTIGSSGSGVTVNPVTNRFYSANLYGGQVLVYDGTDNHQITTVTLGGGFCPGYLDVNPATNLIYVGSQCGGFNDPVHVINGATNSVVAGPLGSGGVMSEVHVNPATRNIYAYGPVTRVWRPDYTFLTDISGAYIMAANAVTNRVYLTTGTDLQVRDGNSHALLATIPGAGGTSSVAVCTVSNRIYVADYSATRLAVEVIDGATNTIVESFSLGQNVTPQHVAVDCAKNRVYVTGSSPSGSTLFIYDDSTLTATGTTLSATVGQEFAAIVATFTDSSSNPGFATDYTAIVDWGDGSDVSTGGISELGGGNFHVAASHTYTAADTYTARVTITDNRDPTRQAIAYTTIQVTGPDSPNRPEPSVLVDIRAATRSFAVAKPDSAWSTQPAPASSNGAQVLPKLPRAVATTHSRSMSASPNAYSTGTELNLGDPLARIDPAVVDVLAWNLHA